MRRRLLRFEAFNVWIFELKAGDRKYFDPDEITRGLTDHGPMTLATIPVVTKGKLEIGGNGQHRIWYPTYGADSCITRAKSLAGSYATALEDSEYHCIVPRDETPRFWARDVRYVEPCQQVYLFSKQYAYVARGSLKGFEEKLIYNSSDKAMPLVPEGTDAIVAFMWLPEKDNPL